MAKLMVTAKTGGERLDVLLAKEITEISRSGAVRLIENGFVTLNGKVMKKNYLAEPDDCFEVELPDPEPSAEAAEDIPLDIVYEDEDMIVINKPRGMVVHPAPGHSSGTLVNALLFHCKGSLSGIGGEERPGIVHRLDKDTSGLMVAAKNDYAHNFLSAQLKERSLSRIYEAVVCGNVREDEGTVEAPIGRHPTDRKKMSIHAKVSREAVTHYQVIARYPGYTHVRCILETGRTHQIRVHMASINRPILGDTVYGHKKAELGQSVQCLHAKKIKFIHPRTETQMQFEVPLPEYFEEVINKLKTLK